MSIPLCDSLDDLFAVPFLSLYSCADDNADGVAVVAVADAVVVADADSFCENSGMEKREEKKMLKKNFFFYLQKEGIVNASI